MLGNLLGQKKRQGQCYHAQQQRKLCRGLADVALGVVRVSRYCCYPYGDQHSGKLPSCSHDQRHTRLLARELPEHAALGARQILLENMVIKVNDGN